VIDGVTGRFYDGSPEDLVRVLRDFDDTAVDSAACVANAARFSTDVFNRLLPRHVARALDHAGPAERRDHSARPTPHPVRHGARRSV
jgi:hypothetical protein